MKAVGITLLPTQRRYHFAQKGNTLPIALAIRIARNYCCIVLHSFSSVTIEELLAQRKKEDEKGSVERRKSDAK